MSLPNPPVLQKLYRLDRTSSWFHGRLSNVLYGEEYQRCVPNLRGEDLVWLVDYLDKALDDLEASSAAFRKCLRELRSICGIRGTLPASYTLSSHLLNIDPDPFATGGHGDVHGGTLDGSRVCVKRVRMYTRDGPQKATKTFCQEAVIWKHLKHPNILPLLGITINPFQLISHWMSGGELSGYIKKNLDADRLGLLLDVANGLCYLHSHNVTHGDLKGPNILVDNSGNALIADFGLATVTQNLDSVQGTTSHRGHTPRWAAPEVLNEGTHSKEADIFSFAMVMIEVFTGAVPFGDVPSPMAVFAITQGKRPPRPTHPTLTTELWALMGRCWNQDPHLRPEVSTVLDVLSGTNRAVRGWSTSPVVAVGPPRSLILEVQQLVDKIHEHRSNIHVAKRESLQLMDLCDNLIKCLNDRSLIPEQSSYEDIKSNLSRVEKELTDWSKYNYLKSLVKKAYIKSGITKHIEQLTSLVSLCPSVRPTPIPLPGGQGINPPHHGIAEDIHQREEIGQEVASAVISPVPNESLWEVQEFQRDEGDELLTVKRLNGDVKKQGELAFAGGTSCEVWVGRWEKHGKGIGREGEDVEKVALKALRTFQSPKRAREKLQRKLSTWAELDHQNLLPLYGIVTDLGPRLYMVSPWQENGDLLRYVRMNPDANKNYLLCGSAGGMSYLHSRGVVHGNVTCKNVLVSCTGKPLICDFGIATIVEGSAASATSMELSGGAVRYSALEILRGNTSPTTASDTFSFAMLILECITEKIPFSELTRDVMVMYTRMIRNEVPHRPDGHSPKNRISDELWGLMRHCWSFQPESRPTMENVHDFFLNV